MCVLCCDEILCECVTEMRCEECFVCKMQKIICCSIIHNLKNEKCSVLSRSWMFLPIDVASKCTRDLSKLEKGQCCCTADPRT